VAAKDKSDLLWGMYQENTTQARHHEGQRQQVTSIAISLAGAILTVVGLDKSVTLADLPLGLFLVALGLWGALFSAKQYERTKLHTERARRYRDALDETVPDASLREIKKSADKEHERDWPRLHEMRLFWFWVSIHLVVSVIGLVVAIFATIRS
jgi:hypothetical protein